MGRGGPAEPTVAAADTSLADLLERRRRRRPRRVRLPRGRGAGGRAHRRLPARGRGADRRAVASRTSPPGRRSRRASPGVGALIFEGSGVVHPAGRGRPHRLRDRPRQAGAARRLPPAARRPAARPRRARWRRPRRCASRCDPSPPSRSRTGARVALFTTGAPACEGVEPEVASREPGPPRRPRGRPRPRGGERLRRLPDRAEGRRDRHGRPPRAEQGARVVFVRNRPVGVDDALRELVDA